MDRETIKKVLPISEKEIEYKAFATQREKREWVRASTKSENELEQAFALQEACINQLVVSFDGSSENLTERLLDLPVEDFKIVDEVLSDVILGKDFLGEKKN